MTEEVSLSAIVSTRNVKKELDVGYSPETILQIILEEIYEYVKISASEREDTEVFLGKNIFVILITFGIKTLLKYQKE